MRVEGLEIAAMMVPAEEVGGDYYDVQATADGAWIGIGDVAGHGLTAGLVMLMIQSIIAALARDNPAAPPGRVLTVLNAVLYENIRQRLRQDEHVTLTLLRYRPDGSFVFAGAHEEIVVCRARGGRCELHPTPGTWVGAIEDISQFVEPSRLALNEGDLMVLYSDGIIQAMNEAGEQFGMDRLCQEIEAMRDRPVGKIVEQVMTTVNAFAPGTRADDMTIMVIRYVGGHQPQVTA
jgi:sigma-B regulation protein RsbU (phosphoserine phosphatase)